MVAQNEAFWQVNQEVRLIVYYPKAQYASANNLSCIGV